MSRALQPDTAADIALRACLRPEALQCFVMIAGAGSGKTTSLIKALKFILEQHGAALRLRRQKVACITYTEVAAEEIWADVGNNPLAHVSTIHSYLWSLISAFQVDIKAWVVRRIAERLTDLRTEATNFGPRVKETTREKNRNDIMRYEGLATVVPGVRRFTYGTGSDYEHGILGHDDIIKMVPQLLVERPLFRKLLAQQFPCVFIDESQDTMENVVAAFKSVAGEDGVKFCLGFFGDPMQQIYATGIGAIGVEPGWERIEKSENFRCPTTVLNVANAIRRTGDGLVQVRGRMAERDGAHVPVPGTSTLFILPADNQRDQRLTAVRAWVAERTGDDLWRDGDNEQAVKVLVIVHRMAATRLGFGDLYAALNDGAPDSFKTGFLEATAWPLKPFLAFVLPLAEAMNAGDEFAVMQVLRSESPLLARERLAGEDIAQRLATLREHAVQLTSQLTPASNATIGDVLRSLQRSGVVELDPRFAPYLAADLAPAAAAEAEGDAGKESTAMQAFLRCPARQFWSYRTYIEEKSPFSTQQGIKGAEFERVLTIVDEEEGSHFQFSYDKYFGLKPLSDGDRKNIREGKETQVDRTRRLFYVCCTRALQDLVVVLFTADPVTAEREIRRLNIFDEGSIYTAAVLEAPRA